MYKALTPMGTSFLGCKIFYRSQRKHSFEAEYLQMRRVAELQQWLHRTIEECGGSSGMLKGKVGNKFDSLGEK